MQHHRHLAAAVFIHKGKFPVWLAPVQVVVMNITDAQADFAREVEKNLTSQGFKVALDLRNEKIGYKIREHTIQRVPYMLVIGDRELENQSVAVRSRDGKDLGSMKINDIAARLAAVIKNRGFAISEG